MPVGRIIKYDVRARTRVKKLRERKRRKAERLRALADSAVRARRFAPGETLDMGFELIESGRSLNRAAEKANPGRRP